MRVQRHERTAGWVQPETGDRGRVTAQRPPAVARGQVPYAYVPVLVAAKHATVRGRYVQRHAIDAGLPLFEQRARLQVVHHDEVGPGLVHFLEIQRLVSGGKRGGALV